MAQRLRKMCGCANVRVCRLRKCADVDMQIDEYLLMRRLKKSAEFMPVLSYFCGYVIGLSYLNICTFAHLHICTSENHFVYRLIISTITLFFCNWGK
jgi:hypothetical protein